MTEVASTRRRKSSLTAPGGGVGRAEVGDSRAVAGPHLTPPLRGPLPLSPEVRRGAFSGAIRAFRRYAPLLLLAIAWEAVSRLGIVPTSALPPLDQVGSAWLNLAESGELWTNGVASISRAAAGLGLAIVCGSAIGVMMAWYLPVRVVINPIVQFFYPMPKSALIPVMVLWLGFGDASKIMLIFVGCLLPITLSAFNGARGTEEVLIWSARSLGASRARVLWEIVVPSALPELLSGIRTALALSFVLLVSSELIVARQGFGYMIGWLGDGGAYDAMFAVVLTVALLGFAADRLYLMLMRRVLAWRE
jgi:NitT/TauT family transport system permease protein